MYYRYIDDVFAIFHRRDESEYRRFFDAITANAPAMKFTITESNDRVNFLDLTIHKGVRFEEKGILDIKIFEKELNKYLYIPRISYHPEKLKAGFIKTETIRFIRNSSSECDFEDTKERFIQRLISRGYLCHWVHRQVQSVHYTERDKLLKGNLKEDKDKLVFPITQNPCLDFNEVRSIMRLTLERLQVTNEEFRKYSNITLGIRSAPSIMNIIQMTYGRQRRGIPTPIISISLNNEFHDRIITTIIKNFQNNIRTPTIQPFGTPTRPLTDTDIIELRPGNSMVRRTGNVQSFTEVITDTGIDVVLPPAHSTTGEIPTQRIRL